MIHRKSPSYSEIAADSSLWHEYMDACDENKYPRFKDMTFEERMNLILRAYGPEEFEGPPQGSVIISIIKEGLE